MAWCLARLERWEETSAVFNRFLAHDRTLKVSTFFVATPTVEAAFATEYVAFLKAAGVSS